MNILYIQLGYNSYAKRQLPSCTSIVRQLYTIVNCNCHTIARLVFKTEYDLTAFCEIHLFKDLKIGEFGWHNV